MVALSIAILILLLLSLDWLVVRYRVRKVGAETEVTRIASVPEPAPPPAARWLSAGHAWARLGDDGLLTLGVDELPGRLLGDVDRLDTVPVRRRLHDGEPLARLHSGMRAVTVHSPVFGRVVQVNPLLADLPVLLASDPWNDGWLCRVAPEQPARDLRHCRLAEDAADWSRRELGRVRDWLASEAGNGVTLADGGLPAAGLAHTLSDDAWNRLERALFAPPRPRRDEQEEPS